MLLLRRRWTSSRQRRKATKLLESNLPSPDNHADIVELRAALLEDIARHRIILPKLHAKAKLALQRILSQEFTLLVYRRQARRHIT